MAWRPVTDPEAQPFYFHGRLPACLLIHGLTSTPWEVRNVGLALRDAGIHAESMWLPGHGSTPAELGKVRWREWVAAVEARFDGMAAQHGSVAVMGTSLGGSLALWLATSRPVTTVVSLGGGVWLNPMARWARWASYVYPFQKKRSEGSSIRDPEARKIHPTYPVMPLRAVGEMFDLLVKLRGRIESINAPLLIIHSRHDSVVDPRNAQYIYDHVASEKKKLIWCENSDHIITEDYDHPMVTSAVVEWLNEIETHAERGEAQVGAEKTVMVTS